MNFSNFKEPHQQCFLQAVYFFASLSIYRMDLKKDTISLMWYKKSLWNGLLTFILLVIISYISTTNSVQKIYFYICNKFVVKKKKICGCSHLLTQKTTKHPWNALEFCKSRLLSFLFGQNHECCQRKLLCDSFAFV